MNRRKFLKTAGMAAAVLVVNPLELIPKRGIIPSKPLSTEGMVIHDGGYYIFQDGSFLIGNKNNYIMGLPNEEIRIKGEIYWT